MKKKLVGKIIAVIFALFTLAFMFMPQITYKATSEGSGLTYNETIVASNVSPLDYIKALFAKEEDLETALADYQAARLEIIEKRIAAGDADMDIEVELSNTKEATRYFVLLLALKDNPLSIPGQDDVSAVKGVKTYAYISIAMIAVILTLAIILIARCFAPKNKFLNVFGNILSIVAFVASIGFMFAAMFPVAEYKIAQEIMGVTYSFSTAITAVPILVMSGAFALVSLITMILALSTKGVRKQKKNA